MRRRGGLRQKPWNKVQRTEKFWVPSFFVDQGGINAPKIQFTTGTQNIVFIDAPTSMLNQATGLAVNPGGSGGALRPTSHAKLHRFQGHLWAWLDNGTEAGVAKYNDGAPGGDYPPPNVEMLTYAWMKVKEVGDAGQGLAGPASLSTYDLQLGALGGMLVRDDLISWGVIPVFGVTPQWYVNRGAAATLAMQMQPMQYHQSHVAKIPWPRLPKGGLNLRRGEALVCMAAKFAGPSAALDANPFISESDTARPVLIADISRRLMSI